MYVVKRTTDGRYLKGRASWTVEWVEDISQARVFHRKGDATLCTRWGVAVERRGQPREHLKVIPVNITEA